MNESGQMIRVTVWGLCLNILLSALKFAVGIVVGSAALIADAVHSLSDLSTDLIAILGIRLSARPADENHAYGHGKLETIAASVIGVILVGAGFYIALRAGFSIYRGESSIPGYPVVIVAIVSIVAKEGIYQVTQRVAQRVRSAALSVNAWHHRSDALSSVAVLFGAIAGLGGWGQADQAAAIVVGMMVSAVGLKALWGLFVELCEGSISNEEQESIAKAIQSVPGVRSWHKLRTRLVGREIFMDVHVLVDGHLSVTEGHHICSTVESNIVQSMERPVNVVVHCEPEPDPDATPEAQPGQQ
ncbi:MAG TPA: cation transporter [Dehalococcoidia bacterium]|nr:cation transporter [Dehalococcoidia bacterium]